MGKRLQRSQLAHIYPESRPCVYSPYHSKPGPFRRLEAKDSGLKLFGLMAGDPGRHCMSTTQLVLGTRPVCGQQVLAPSSHSQGQFRSLNPTKAPRLRLHQLFPQGLPGICQTKILFPRNHNSYVGNLHIIILNPRNDIIISIFIEKRF